MSILTVTTPAAVTDLTTLETVKAELGVAGAASDIVLARMIAQASGAAGAYCGRVFAREAVSETFRPPGPQADLRLARWPVVSIASVTEDGTALAAEDYELDAASGLLMRLSDDAPTAWTAAKIVVAYEAGYRLPGEAGRTLPADIERAVLDMVKAAWTGRTRDTTIQQESVPGVYSVTYSTDAASAAGTLSPSVRDLLDPYRAPALA